MQTLYTNGNIITMTGTNAECLLEADGVIVYVGRMAEAASLLKSGYRYFDLEGHTLLPGFIDAHSHLMATAIQSLQVDLTGLVTFQEIKDKITQYISTARPPENAWIKCHNFDAAKLKEKQCLSSSVLDQICCSHPLLIQSVSGHSGVFNSRGLKIVQNFEGWRDGACTEKNAEGTLNGVVKEKVYLDLISNLPPENYEDILAAVKRTQLLYASYGITTCQEGFMDENLLTLAVRLKQDQAFSAVETVGYVDPALAQEADAFLGGFHGGYCDNFRLGGLKIFLDGSLQEKTAYLTEPYLESGRYCGYPALRDSEINAAIAVALKYQTQLLAHANGDAAINQYLECLEKADSALQHLRPVIIHAQLLEKSRMASLKSTGAIPSFFIGHTYYWGDVHIANLGYGRASRISPCRSCLEARSLFTLHQDSPVTKPDMVFSLWCAVNRLTSSGIVLGPEERIAIYDALKAVTANAAFQYFEERNKGTLEAGKWADLVILDRNPLTTDPMKLKDLKVLLTVKKGVTVFIRP